MKKDGSAILVRRPNICNCRLAVCTARFDCLCLSEHDGGMDVRVIIIEDIEASVRVEVDGSIMPAPLDPHVPALAVKVHLAEELTFRIPDLLFFFRHTIILSRGAGEVIRLVQLG